MSVMGAIHYSWPEKLISSIWIQIMCLAFIFSQVIRSFWRLYRCVFTWLDILLKISTLGNAGVHRRAGIFRMFYCGNSESPINLPVKSMTNTPPSDNSAIKLRKHLSVRQIVLRYSDQRKFIIAKCSGPTYDSYRAHWVSSGGLNFARY